MTRMLRLEAGALARDVDAEAPVLRVLDREVARAVGLE